MQFCPSWGKERGRSCGTEHHDHTLADQGTFQRQGIAEFFQIVGAWGSERIISALYALPRVRARAYLSILPVKLKKQCEQEILYRYITDGIQMITENTAVHEGQSYLSISYTDIIHPKPKETRSTEDIIADVIKKAGLKLVTKGGEPDGG